MSASLPPSCGRRSGRAFGASVPVDRLAETAPDPSLSALGIPAAGFGPKGADEAFWPTPRPPFGLRGLQVAAHLDPGRRLSRLLLLSVADTARSYDCRL